jgi:hypothetical protein
MMGGVPARQIDVQIVSLVVLSGVHTNLKGKPLWHFCVRRIIGRKTGFHFS